MNRQEAIHDVKREFNKMHPGLGYMWEADARATRPHLFAPRLMEQPLDRMALPDAVMSYITWGRTEDMMSFWSNLYETMRRPRPFDFNKFLQNQALHQAQRLEAFIPLPEAETFLL